MKLAYIDANVILRFLTGEPDDMASQARALFNVIEQGRIKLVIDEIVVAEGVWVLKSFYGYPNHDIARIVQELLSHEGFEADDKPGLLAALSIFAEKTSTLPTHWWLSTCGNGGYRRYLASTEILTA